MTAFGRGEAEADGYRFTVELRSVNHRFCDVQLKGPKKSVGFEEEVKRLVSARFSRGRIEVIVVADETLEKIQHLTINLELARTYTELLAGLQKELGLEGAVHLEALLNFRDIFVFQEDEQRRKQAWIVLETALEQAVGNCLKMRAEEGTAIERDFTKRLGRLENLVKEVETRAPFVVQETRDRLQQRIEHILGETPVDEARLAQEVAIFAEKSDITEEVVRLQSHFRQFRDLLAAAGPHGRQLEFLLQEMHREISTIGSKAGDLAVAQNVIKVKTELERLREQVQNVE
jgi:uncharacterized protein (TIGR00255 family)